MKLLHRSLLKLQAFVLLVATGYTHLRYFRAQQYRSVRTLPAACARRHAYLRYAWIPVVHTFPEGLKGLASEPDRRTDLRPALSAPHAHTRLGAVWRVLAVMGADC